MELILGYVKALLVCSVDNVTRRLISALATKSFEKISYTIALTPRQYLSHMDRNLGWPPRSQLAASMLDHNYDQLGAQ